jgi:hypothetical protein
VPLRILALGKKATEFVQADVYLLTDGRPALLPASDPGVDVARNEPASDSLLSDLRADKGMSWVAPSMWLTYLRLNVPAGLLRYDLAVDAHGTGHPSRVAAGLPSLAVPHPSGTAVRAVVLAVLAGILGLAGGGLIARRAWARAM